MPEKVANDSSTMERWVEAEMGVVSGRKGSGSGEMGRQVQFDLV